MTKPKPQGSPIIYRDHLALYLEFPTYCLRFAFTEGGLAKALKHVPNIASAEGYLGRPGNVPEGLTSVSGKIARITQRRARKASVTAGSEELKSAIGDLIRKAKI